MECYAPLLVNVSPADPAKGYPKAWQWPTNLIGYDALHSFGSPSYYAQAMLGQNKGDVVAPRHAEGPPAEAAAEPAPHGSIGVGTFRTQVEYKDIVVTAPDGHTLLTADLSERYHGSWQFTGGKWDLQDKAIKPSTTDAESWATPETRPGPTTPFESKPARLQGRERLRRLWHATDANNYNRWTVGGNEQHCTLRGRR